jgi:predicted porin
MKKTILATIVPTLLLANTAFAGGVDLIKNDDMVLNLNGDVDLIIKNMDDNEGTQIEVNLDDLDFRFKYMVSSDLTFIAGADWSSEYESKDTIFSQYAWAGVEYANLTTTLGLQTSSFDPFGIEKFELMSMGRASGDQDGTGTDVEQSIKMDYEMGKFVLSGTYQVQDDKTELNEVQEVVVSADFGDLEMMAGVGHEENYDASTTEYSSDYYQVQAEYKMGSWVFGALYGAKSNERNDAKAESNGYELNALYKVNDELSVHAGYEIIDTDIDGADTYKGAAIGAIYTFSPVVKLYMEVGQEEGAYLSGANSVSKKDVGDLNQVGMLLSLDF